LNADQSSCDSASGPITLYNSDIVSVTCSNCFIGFHADVFFNLEIRGFVLRSVSGGFKDVFLDGGIGLDMNAQVEKPILSVDKELWKGGGEDHPILSFHIASIPFSIWFDSSISV